MERMERMDIRYVAGLVDADGSFCITMTDKRNKGANNCLTVSWVVNYRCIFEDVVRKVHAKMGVGAVYYSKGPKEDSLGIWSWQTTNLRDSLKAAQRLYPHLHIKKETYQSFIEVLQKWIAHVDVSHDRARLLNRVTKPRWLIEEVFDVALNLNKCAQTKTARRNKIEKIEAMRNNIVSFYDGKVV